MNHDRIKMLTAELAEVQKEMDFLCGLYNRKMSQNHWSTEINVLGRRKYNIQINLNQERQKR